MSKFDNVFLVLSRRTCGVLLHVSSLPGSYGIGDLGPSAYQWIDLLAASGQRWWQILPLGPSGEDNSPYRCYSAFAGNPLLISPDLLVQDGLLNRAELRSLKFPAGQVDYPAVTKAKLAILKIAYERFTKTNKRLRPAYSRFVKQQASWLEDFALFMALRDANPSVQWTQWPKPILRRQPAAMSAARAQFADAIAFHQFVQFIFDRQLRALRDHARRAGVGLIGDLPIFISPDSVDVWTHPELFQLDANLQPKSVAGVPPDLFSADGQRWGNPLYNWKQMAKDHFQWWKNRLDSALSQADLVRIDHFRGFEAYWSIPNSSPTAKNGRWIKAPGVELFKSLMADNAKLPLLAEDLGIITPEVEQLRDQFNLPGMRVLQFGFGDDPANTHSPHNFIANCFAYTGTHDNDTTTGWYNAMPAKSKRQVERYAPELNWKTEASWSMIRLLLSSVARHAIVPLQDLLELDSTARMNMPGLGNNNWKWRLNDFKICGQPLHRLGQLGQLYGR